MIWYWIPYLFPVLFRIEFPLRAHFWVSSSYLAIFSFIVNKYSVLTIYQNMHIDALYKWTHLIFTAIIWGGYYYCSSLTDEKIGAQTGQSTSQLVSGRTGVQALAIWLWRQCWKRKGRNQDGERLCGETPDWPGRAALAGRGREAEQERG